MEKIKNNPLFGEFRKLFFSKLIIIYLTVMFVISSIVELVESNTIDFISYKLIKHNLDAVTTFQEEPLNNLNVLLNNCLLVKCTYLSVSANKYRYFYELGKKQDNEHYLIYVGRERYDQSDTIITNHFIYPFYSYKNIVFYNTKKYIYTFFKYVLEHITIFLWFLWTVFYLIGGILYIKYKNRERFINTKIVADSVQKELSESLHHEIRSPLTVIKVIGLNLRDTLNSYMANSHKCEVDNKLGKKVVCLDIPKVEIEELNKELDLFINTVERIEGTVSILGRSKHIRGGEDYTINKIVDNFKSVKLIMQTVKPIFKVINLKVDRHPIVPELNIVITNILDTLVNNSLEAGATLISIYPLQTVQEYYGRKAIFLYVEDDGGGIRDKEGNINPKLDIFKYGFSTKDKLATRKANFFTKLFGLDTEISNTRGIGLNVNREAIRSYGGELSLFKTNRVGTIFQIVIPISDKISNKEDSLYGNL